MATAFITGASRGIGKAVAKSLLDQGYDLFLVSQNPFRLKQTFQEFTNQYPARKIGYMACDISDENLVKESVLNAVELLSNIDVVFNNAGVYQLGSLDMDSSEFQRVMNVNLFGATFVAKHTVNVMKKQNSGYLINLSSVCGKYGFSGVGAYTASKFALTGLNECLFHELPQYGIKVTAICPSFVATDMSAHAPFGDEMMIQTEDIAKTVNYLLSLSSKACPKEIIVECLSSPL